MQIAINKGRRGFSYECKSSSNYPADLDLGACHFTGRSALLLSVRRGGGPARVAGSQRRRASRGVSEESARVCCATQTPRRPIAHPRGLGGPEGDPDLNRSTSRTAPSSARQSKGG